MKKNLLILFLLVAGLMQAQPGKEAWQWHFGFNTSLDFSSGIPVAGNSPIAIGEGSATISSKSSGQLLFFTDGVKVWNRNKQQMPNGYGLLGHASSTQSAFIVPKPGDTSQYYIFTSPAQCHYSSAGIFNFVGVYFSVVDMQMNGGLGDVIIKNQLLTPPPVTENLAAAKHCDGIDYWLITRPMGGAVLNSYLITRSGISLNPVVSAAAISLNDSAGDYTEARGMLKMSPNGKKLACNVFVAPNRNDSSFLEIYDFNNSTGQITNPLVIGFKPVQGSGVFPYGLSFSPDNSKIYVGLFGIGELRQYDLSSGILSTIIASKKIIASNFYTCYGMQLGPDAKIYIARGDSSLAVINDPNNVGSACNFQFKGVQLTGGGELGLSYFMDGGLGNYLPAVQNLNGNQCGVFLNDTVSVNGAFSSYQWSNGDTSSTTIITQPGVYWLSVKAPGASCWFTDTFRTFVLVPTKIDTELCGPINVNASQPGAQYYHWFDGTLNPSRTFSVSSAYWVDVGYTGGCSVRDTFIVTTHPYPAVNMGDTIQWCSSYLHPAVIVLHEQGDYLWSTGDTTNQLVTNIEAPYWVQITTTYGCVIKDSFYLKTIPYPKIDLGTDTAFCKGDLRLNVFNNASTYLWSSGQTVPEITVSGPGEYWVKVDMNGCTSYDTLLVHPQLTAFNFEMPNIVTPNNDNTNDAIDFGKYQFSSVQIEIYNRWGQKVFASENADAIWKPTGDEGTYFYTAQYKIDCGTDSQTKEIKGFITVIR